MAKKQTRASEDLPASLLALLSDMAATDADLEACGPSAFAMLRSIHSLFRQSPPNNKRAAALASSLVRLSNEKILSFNYKDVPMWWRRMYTDGTLLRVVALLLEDSEVDDKGSRANATKDLVKELDMALIVAAAPGIRRNEMVFQLIAAAQARISSPPESDRPAKRPRFAIPRIPAPYLDNPILRLSEHPSFEEFLSLSASPFVVTAGCASWPARSSWSSPSYLLDRAGPGRVVPVEVGSNYTTDGWGQRIIPFEEFLDSLSRPDAETLYLAQHDFFKQCPALLDDVVVPDLVYSAPKPTEDAPNYRPPAAEEGYVLNAWLGPAGTLSPAHTDPYYNYYAQVVGAKWVWVAPPTISASMTTFGAPPSSSSSTALPTSPELDESSTSVYMSNTARIDVTDAPGSSPLATFPDYVAHVLPVAKQAVLEEGDMLYMPPGWWHALKSLEVSFSVSIWF